MKTTENDMKFGYDASLNFYRKTDCNYLNCQSDEQHYMHKTHFLKQPESTPYYLATIFVQLLKMASF